jgi:hypothetical protein
MQQDNCAYEKRNRGKIGTHLVRILACYKKSIKAKHLIFKDIDCFLGNFYYIIQLLKLFGAYKGESEWLKHSKKHWA